MNKDNRGYIYILFNKHFKNWYKIGRTKNLDKRLQTYNTGAPLRDYEFIFSIKVSNMGIEQEIHTKLIGLNYLNRNEWFKGNIKEIQKLILELL
jgi:predicted GIY-YIG superfamily endonuclease